MLQRSFTHRVASLFDFMGLIFVTSLMAGNPVGGFPVADLPTPF